VSEQQQCIIVGGSHAAASLAPALRQQGWQGGITIVSNEYFLPYHRPPLSKAFLTGGKSLEDILIRQPAAYQQAGVSIMLGATVSAIDPSHQRITLEHGQQLAYTKLVLATGARVRKLSCPGADLKGVFYLRDANDVMHIKGAAPKAKRAVIIGGGYIGLETAASLRKLGLDVTVLEAMPRILQRVTSPEISAFYTRIHTEEGVTIATSMAVESLEGDTKVTAVRCQDGTRYEADMVIVGIGVLPNVELAEAAGLAVDNGIVVDELTQTSDPNILAIGDCTKHPNPLYDRMIRLESVQNANDQGITAAHTLCGKHKPYAALPWFWSDQYDLKLQIAGLNHDFDRVILRGDSTQGRSFAAYYLQGERVLAVDAINRPQEFMLARKALSQGQQFAIDKLADESIDVKNLLI
jgi:3-phenylpropionate/trans-cinnamate dioxygenase ferredoxin reductase subunit